jgi:hypothetical protein
MKTDLFENVGLFQEDLSLLCLSDYEVKSRVPEPIFAKFVRGIEGYCVTLSEDTLESFHFLAEEFRCEKFSAKCRAIKQTGEWRGSTLQLMPLPHPIRTLNLNFLGKCFVSRK